MATHVFLRCMCVAAWLLSVPRLEPCAEVCTQYLFISPRRSRPGQLSTMHTGPSRSCDTPRWSELSMSMYRSQDQNIRQDPEPEDIFVSEGGSSSVFPSLDHCSGNFFLRCMECLGGQVWIVLKSMAWRDQIKLWFAHMISPDTSPGITAADQALDCIYVCFPVKKFGNCCDLVDRYIICLLQNCLPFLFTISIGISPDLHKSVQGTLTCKFKVVSTYHFIVWEAVAQQENTMRGWGGAAVLWSNSGGHQQAFGATEVDSFICKYVTTSSHLILSTVLQGNECEKESRIT